MPTNIPYLRIYELSIINYLKYEILPLYFLEQQTNVPLIENPDTDVGGYVADTKMDPLPTSEGRGWAIFDEATVAGKQVVDTTGEQSSSIVVNGATSYVIDYLNGAIKNPNTIPTSISYYWNYVSFIASWPGAVPPPLPVISLDVSESSRSGFQLGGGSKDVLNCAIYVFASNEVEKRDIVSVIHDALFSRNVPIRNWHDGGYLKYDGTFNTGFVPTPVSGLTLGYFTNVEAQLSGFRIDWSEINRHRSKITFELEVFRD